MRITVYAEDSGLELRGEGFELLAGNIKTADDLVDAVQSFNIDLDFDDIFFSSSMDFAEEYGFKTNNCAKDLFNAGIRAYYNG